MGAYGVAVEFDLPNFRGSTERSSHVFHYAITAPVEDDYNNLADAVVDHVKWIYPTTVLMRTVRVFGPTEGPKEDNKMRLVKDVSGGGTHAYAGTDMYPELAIVVARYVGRSPVKNRKVFVRKYVHPCKLMSASDSNITGALSTATRTEFNTWMANARQLIKNAAQYNQVTPLNRPVPNDHAPFTLPFMHIRQLKQ